MRANLPISTIPRVTVGASIARPRADASIGPYRQQRNVCLYFWVSDTLLVQTLPFVSVTRAT